MEPRVSIVTIVTLGVEDASFCGRQRHSADRRPAGEPQRRRFGLESGRFEPNLSGSWPGNGKLLSVNKCMKMPGGGSRVSCEFVRPAESNRGMPGHDVFTQTCSNFDRWDLHFSSNFRQAGSRDSSAPFESGG